MIFARAENSNAYAMQLILKGFTNVSGLKQNKASSQLFLSNFEWQCEAATILSVESNTFRSLRTPLICKEAQGVLPPIH